MNVLVFWEDGFPFLDTVPLSADALQSAFGHRDTVRSAGVAELPEALRTRPDLLLTPYGSAFPKTAWTALKAYLAAGGNWVNLGGSPVSTPVRRSDPASANAGWHIEAPQPAYQEQLLIRHAMPVEVPTDAALLCPPPDVALDTHFRRFRPKRVWELQPRLATRKDFQDEPGSSGPRDGLLRALVVAQHEGRTVAAPVVAIDWTAGVYSGGRWVLATCEGNLPLPADLVRRLSEYAVRARATVVVRPSFACYYPGELAALSAQVRPSSPGDLRISLRVYSQDSQREVYAHVFRAHAGISPAAVQTSPFPAPDPGLYIVRASVEAEGHSKPIAAAETGFWVYDRDLMASEDPITPTPGLFERGARPYPVTGTTYMAGDANRKFLFEPNPAAWDADLAAMREAGVNLVRTGFWTGWRRAMLDPGAVDEGVLRALAAFLLTARRHELPVLFTFFSMLPEAWGGDNPYLDPGALGNQIAFVSAFARRFASVGGLWWDLIGEPSFSSEQHDGRCRPNYDQFEQTAWAEWLQGKGLSEMEWRERWGLTPDEPLSLPAPADFGDLSVRRPTRLRRVLDYRLFAEEVFAGWVARLRDAIRENGNSSQLVTVGHHEFGPGERPSRWLRPEAVDFTSNHTGQASDDLLWGSLVAKAPTAPCLIEGIGAPGGERLDRQALRTPAEARSLIERRMALSFAGGSAGSVLGQWHTDIHAAPNGEIAPSFLRADGTETLEMGAFREVARFMAQNAHLMAGHEPEEVVVVLPGSLMLSDKQMAVEACRRAVRALEQGLGLPCRIVAEHQPELLTDARLLVLPSARVLSEACWQALLSKAQRGATLVVTGFVEADEQWRRADRLGPFGISTRPVPVQANECLASDREARTWCRFGRTAIESAEKAEVAGEPGLSTIRRIRCGEGNLIYCSLPLELADDPCAEPLYRQAAAAAGLEIQERPAPVLVRPVRFRSATLVIVVNETGHDFDSRSTWAPPHGLSVPAGRAAMALIDRSTGDVLDRYQPQ